MKIRKIMFNYCVNRILSHISQNTLSQKIKVTFVLISKVVLNINYHWMELICHCLSGEKSSKCHVEQVEFI